MKKGGKPSTSILEKTEVIGTDGIRVDIID
jgi:hypothetical protein